MRRFHRHPIVLAAAAAALGLWAALSAAAAPASRDDEAGIAGRYPDDRGIEADKSVLLHDDFEGADFSRWDENQHAKTTALERDAKLAHSGEQCVAMTAIVPAPGSGEKGSTGGGLIKWFKPGLDVIYARFYVRFEKDPGYVHHFVHIVGGRDKWSGFGKAGLKPDGTDFFTTGIEPDAKWGRVPPPGVWHFYTYWPDMKASPDKMFWGNDFAPRIPIPVDVDRWICVEVMVTCNAPEQSDGEQAFWIDGKPAGKFDGFRWRTTGALKVNAFWLMYYLTPEALQRAKVKPAGQRYTVRFDDVVVATKYIGPMKTKPAAPAAGKFTPPAGY